MSSLGSPNPLLFGAAKAYEIERSLRFNSADDAYIGFTPSSTGSQKVWTWSGWVKRTKMGVYTNLMTGPNHSGEHNNGVVQLAISNADQLYTYFDTDGSNPYGALHDAKFRDPSAWYHIVWKVDAANTEQRIWVNGVEYTTASGQNPPDYAYAMNKSGHQMTMGATAWDGVSGHSDLYLAEVHYCDGQEYQASDFGETDEDTGQWIPKEVSGITYGTNGCYLDFSDNSNTTAATLGKDSSGNSNNWTPNNFSVTAGVGNDSFEDTPTNNYCILNTLSSNATTLNNGGLYWVGDTGTSNFLGGKGSFGMKSGKWYWEHTCTTAGYSCVGLMPVDKNYNKPMGDDVYADGAVSYAGWNGSTMLGNGTTGTSWATYGNTWTTNDVIGIAFDADNNAIYFSKNGTWQDSATASEIAAGTTTNAAYTGLTKEYYPLFTSYSSGAGHVNFGQRAFAHTPPTGFKALCTANLPTPTIKKGTDYFNTVLYTGTGTTDQAKTVGFQPDLLWLKKRNNADDHIITDSVITPPDYLKANTTGAEATYAEGIKSLDANGFTLGSANNTNQNTHTFASWSWKESASAGFDIVSYTGTGADLNVSHGLGVAPDLLIIKGRETTNDWAVLFKDNDNGDFLQLNSNAAESGAGSIFGSTFTRPTSSVFTVGNTGETGTNDKDYIAYLWASVEGFSKISAWSGTASTDGPFVYCGFRPAYLLQKRASDSGTWHIFDDKRNTYNPTNKTLYAENTGAEYTNTGSDPQIDFLSNGFKVRSSYSQFNGSNDTLLFMAFAKSPFKYANAH